MVRLGCRGRIRTHPNIVPLDSYHCAGYAAKPHHVTHHKVLGDGLQLVLGGFFYKFFFVFNVFCLLTFKLIQPLLNSIISGVIQQATHGIQHIICALLSIAQAFSGVFYIIKDAILFQLVNKTSNLCFSFKVAVFNALQCFANRPSVNLIFSLFLQSLICIRFLLVYVYLLLALLFLLHLFKIGNRLVVSLAICIKVFPANLSI